MSENEIRTTKVIYLFDWNGRSDSGVVQKVSEQIREWINLGIEVELILLSPPEMKLDNITIPVFRFEYSSNFQRFIRRIQVIKFLKKCKKDWLLYRRYALLLPHEVFAMKSIRTVIELNTNNSVFYRNRGMIQSLWQKIQNKPIAKYALAACAVTQEIKSINSKSYTRVEAFTNAVDLQHFSEKGKSPLNKKLIFLAGADFSWNGMEQLEILARALPNFTIDVYGIPERTSPRLNIRFKPYLDKFDIQSTVSNYLAGIAPLSLESVGLNEAAPLKTRQYLMNGIPVIGKFDDSGIDEKSKLYFKIDIEKNTNSISNLADLKAFLGSCESLQIKKNDLKSIDIKYVEKCRIDFMIAACKKS